MTDSNIRQSIDGFGGLLTFSETPVSDEALEAVINGLNLNLIRARGEVSPSGDPIHNRELLRRAMKLNPDLEVLLTFWQPKSAIHPHREYWLDEVDLDDASVYILKTEREDEWANEIVHRVNLYRDWGVNVTAVSVQNNSNSSRVGTESCRWEPDRLADFVERKIRPGLNAAGLNEVRIAAPELSCLGPKALMIDQYIPVLTSPAVDLAAYHLFADETNAVADLKALIRDTRSTQSLRLQHFPDKGIWMTETMGVPGPSEHDTAINAARCLHTAMVEGEASAFLWGKLIDQDGEESLIVYPSEEGPLVRPKKYYTYRQFSAFVKPGFNRLEVDSPEAVEVSAFVSPDKQRLVSVVINSSESATALNYKAPGNMKLIGTFQTDQSRNCGPVDPASPMPGRSVRTLVYSR